MWKGWGKQSEPGLSEVGTKGAGGQCLRTSLRRRTACFGLSHESSLRTTATLAQHSNRVLQVRYATLRPAASYDLRKWCCGASVTIFCSAVFEAALQRNPHHQYSAPRVFHAALNTPLSLSY